MVTKKQNYHHGDLRQALAGAALSVLKEEGITKVSLRSIARKAGVSQAAPYSHFPDKNALLVEVAAVGFEVFHQALAEPSPKSAQKADLKDYLLKLGITYVRFALENKPLFQLMFGDALSDIPKNERYMQGGQAAYAVIEQAVKRVSTDPGAPLAAWSVVHGLATLMVDGKIPVAKDLEKQVVDVLKFQSFVRGLPVSS